MSKAYQMESPSGAPHGLEFHALKELSVGMPESNLLLKSMFVTQLLLLLILKFFCFPLSNFGHEVLTEFCFHETERTSHMYLLSHNRTYLPY